MLQDLQHELLTQAPAQEGVRQHTTGEAEGRGRETEGAEGLGGAALLGDSGATVAGWCGRSHLALDLLNFFGISQAARASSHLCTCGYIISYL